MRSPLHYWPVFHREMMASSTVRSMGNASRGIFFFLCMAQWEDEKLPSEDAKLKHLIQATARDWREFKEFLDHCFPICDDDFRRNSQVANDRDAITEKVRRNQRSGRLGGLAKAANANRSVEPNSSKTLANSELELELESKLKRKKLTDKKPSPSLMEKPTASEVCVYMTEKGFPDPEDVANEFVNYYTSKGWKIGNSPMVDWHGAVGTWQARFKRDGRWEKPGPERPFGIPLDEDEEACYFDEEDGVWRSMITRRVVPAPNQAEGQ